MKDPNPRAVYGGILADVSFIFPSFYAIRSKSALSPLSRIGNGAREDIELVVPDMLVPRQPPG